MMKTPLYSLRCEHGYKQYLCQHPSCQSMSSELVVEGVVDDKLDNCIDSSMCSDEEDNIECFEDANDNGNKEPTEDSNNGLLHEGFLCNVCNSTISGYRYTCVQCPDYDLCGSCEARGAHCLHYVLRIPRPKPYGEIKSLLDSVRTSLILINCAPEQVNILDINDIKSEIKDEEDDPFLFDPFLEDEDIEHNPPETIESERIPGDPMIDEIDTIEFVDASTNNENIPPDNPNGPKIAGSQLQKLLNTVEMKPIILKSRNDKIPPPCSFVPKHEDPIETEIYTIDFVDDGTNNEDIPLDNPNEPKIAGSQHQITNTVEMKPIILKSRNEKISPPPSSERKPEDPIKTGIDTVDFVDASTNNENIPLDKPNGPKIVGSQHQISNAMEMKPIILKSRNDKIPPPPSFDNKSAELVKPVVHRDQTTLPRDRHKPVVSQTDYKRLLNITTKPSAIKVISKQGTAGWKTATDRVVHVFTMAKRVKKKKIPQDVRLLNGTRLSKEEIKAVMKNVR